MFYVHLLLRCQSWLISWFLSLVLHQQLVCFHFAKFYHLICHHISPVGCSAFSLSLSLHQLSFFPAVSDCYLVIPVHFYTFAIIIGQWKDCRPVHTHCSSMSRPKTGKKDNSSSSLLRASTQKAPYHTFLFSFPSWCFQSEKLGKNGWVVLICMPWYVWMRSHILHKYLVNQHRYESQGWIGATTWQWNHRWGWGLYIRRGPAKRKQKNIQDRRFQGVQRCQTCSIAAYALTSKKRKKRNYFYKLFLTSGKDH